MELPLHFFQFNNISIDRKNCLQCWYLHRVGEVFMGKEPFSIAEVLLTSRQLVVLTPGWVVVFTGGSLSVGVGDMALLFLTKEQ